MLTKLILESKSIQQKDQPEPGSAREQTGFLSKRTIPKTRRLRAIPRYSKKKQSPAQSKSSKYLSIIRNKTLLPELNQQNLKDERLKHELQQEEDEEEEAGYADSRNIRVCEQKAVLNYYKHYKNLQRIKEQNVMAGIDDSAFTALLSNSQRFNLLPLKIGLVKQQGKQSEVKINSFKIGDQYAQILSEGLSCARDAKINKFKLRDNRMTERGASALLSRIAGQAEVLDLSQNRIVRIDENLVRSIAAKQCRLEYLNLQSNRLGDKSAIQLIGALKSNQSLNYLNLSQNMLSNSIADSIAVSLLSCTALKELYLKWNRVLGPGGQLIFNSLAKNKDLRVLDLSFNLLGTGSCSAASSICRFLIKNNSLLHLDLSDNNFSLEDCCSIGEALSKNHSLYGLHFQGNYGYVDTKGFLVIQGQDRVIKRANYLNSSFRLKGIGVQISKKIEKYDMESQVGCCWVCEGWSQILLQSQGKDDLTVHFSHEGYQPRLMSPGEGDRRWYKTMVPPGCVSFYYTCCGDQMLDCNHQVQQFDTKSAGRQSTVKRNVVRRSARGLFDDNYETETSVKPRFKQYSRIKQSVKWQFPKSVWFPEWKPIDKEFDLQCFERDWNMSRIPKIVRREEDLQLVRESLKLNYQRIRNLYKYFSAVSPIGDVWAVSAGSFVEFCNNFKLIDSRYLLLKFVDLAFISTNSSTAAEWKGNPRNPERGLVRYQFMESLVRLADQKYLKTGIIQSYSQSLKSLLNDIIPYCSKFDPQPWRELQYFVEQNDLLIKKYRPVLELVYRKHARLKVKPGQKPFMCLEEFKQVCVGCKFELQDRDLSISLNYSIALQLDELESDRIYKATFLEFVQAFARVCYLSNLGIYGCSEQRLEIKTYFKFEHGIYLLHNLLDQSVKTAFPLPELSLFLSEKQQIQ